MLFYFCNFKIGKVVCHRVVFSLSTVTASNFLAIMLHIQYTNLLAIEVYLILSRYKFISYRGISRYKFTSYIGISRYKFTSYSGISRYKFTSYSGISRYKFICCSGIYSHKFVSFTAVSRYI